MRERVGDVWCSDGIHGLLSEKKHPPTILNLSAHLNLEIININHDQK